jgi:trimethylamine---corrinoid protein Co-methyltransferase
MRHEDVINVHEAGLRILEQTGVVFHEDEAVEMLRARGCRVEGKRVWLPAKVVDAAVASAPRSFTLRGRVSGRDLLFGNGLVVAGAGGATFVAEGKNLRPGTVADLQTALRLLHMARNVDMVGGIIGPSDVAPERQYRIALFHCLTVTDKPVLWSTARPDHLQSTLDVAAILWGDSWFEEQRLLSVANSTSPLFFEPDTCRAIITFARLGQPICVTPCVMGGTSGPVTLAGILALQHAEALAGLPLTEVVREGAPFIYGGTSSIASMLTGDLLLGVPQYWALMEATVSIARFLGLPCRAGGGLTDSHVLDTQAGIETAMGLETVARGVHLLMHGTGVLSAFNAVSFEKLVVDDELLGMIRARSLPIPVDEDSLGLDTIDRVGPGGNYVLEAHTVRHCRDYERPTFFNRRRHDVWLGRGGLDLAAAARDRMQAMLESWEAPTMDAKTHSQLERYCLG